MEYKFGHISKKRREEIMNMDMYDKFQKKWVKYEDLAPFLHNVVVKTEDESYVLYDQGYDKYIFEFYPEKTRKGLFFLFVCRDRKYTFRIAKENYIVETEHSWRPKIKNKTIKIDFEEEFDTGDIDALSRALFKYESRMYASTGDTVHIKIYYGDSMVLDETYTCTEEESADIFEFEYDKPSFERLDEIEKMQILEPYGWKYEPTLKLKYNVTKNRDESYILDRLWRGPRYLDDDIGGGYFLFIRRNRYFYVFMPHGSNMRILVQQTPHYVYEYTIRIDKICGLSGADVEALVKCFKADAMLRHCDDVIKEEVKCRIYYDGKLMMEEF